MNTKPMYVFETGGASPHQDRIFSGNCSKRASMGVMTSWTPINYAQYACDVEE